MRIKELFLILLRKMPPLKVRKHGDRSSFLYSLSNLIWFICNGHEEQATSKGSKRKNGDNDMNNCKAPKLDESTSEGATRNKGKLVVTCDSNTSLANLHQKLKEQSDTLWKLKDELKKHVLTAELRDMLESNGQDPSGPERHLLDRW